MFREAGYGEIIDQGALPHSEWTVWTPDSREDPLYAYTPDLAGDTSAEQERVAELLAEADLGTERFSTSSTVKRRRSTPGTPAHRTTRRSRRTTG